jgi:hypothetical protein
LPSADDLFHSQYEVIAGMQFNRFWFNLSNPHLWPWQVGHDRHPAAGGVRRRADSFDALRMTREIAVRKVKPRDVHACADKAFQHLRCFGGWTDRSDNFCFGPEDAISAFSSQS